MRTLNLKGLLISSLLTSSLGSMVQAADVNLAEAAVVSASSQRAGYGVEKVNDGVVSDASRWLAGETDPKPWVELTSYE